MNSPTGDRWSADVNRGSDVKLADVSAVAVVVRLVVDDLQLAVLVYVAVVPLDVAVRVSLLVPELAVVPADEEMHFVIGDKVIGSP